MNTNDWGDVIDLDLLCWKLIMTCGASEMLCNATSRCINLFLCLSFI